MKSACLFLDRDGVINEDYGYVHTPEKTQFLPGIFELVQAANKVGWKVVVVTNQAGIARGLYSEAQFRIYSEWMSKQFLNAGAVIDHIEYCPHHPEGIVARYSVQCLCRKPGSLMITRAASSEKIDLRASIFIGDKVSDMIAAQAAGIEARILLDASRTTLLAESLHATAVCADMSAVRETTAELWSSRG